MSGKTKAEDEFERTIDPHMRVVCESAKAFGIPMFSTFQITPSVFHTFCFNEQRSNLAKIKIMSMMDKTETLDDFFEALLRDALENGHDSVFLESMGIPRNPKVIENYDRIVRHLRSLMPKQ